jgi:DNA processing protein
LSDSALRWAALNLHLRAHPRLRRRIVARVVAGDDPVAAYRAGVEPPDASLLAAARAEIELGRRHGVSFLTLADEAYPALLKASSDPPPFLYVRGRLQAEDVLAIAVVGSRRATPHGIEQARRIAGGLAARGFVVVSGLARGIDAAGHRGALEAGGRTVAVLGSGLQRVYPAEHRRLAEAIAERGAVISEFPLTAPPLKYHFPERNRLIAWLTWATVVVEAAADSGSLITADLAAGEGRMVYAVPGPVGEPQTVGTNRLLRQGALVCRDAGDVIEDLAPQLVEAAGNLTGDRAGNDFVTGGERSTRGDDPARRLNTLQRQVLAEIPATRGVQLEALGRASRLEPGRLLAVLLELEMEGLIKQLPGLRFMAAGSLI